MLLNMNPKLQKIYLINITAYIIYLSAEQHVFKRVFQFSLS